MNISEISYKKVVNRTAVVVVETDERGLTMNGVGPAYICDERGRTYVSD